MNPYLPAMRLFHKRLNLWRATSERLPICLIPPTARARCGLRLSWMLFLGIFSLVKTIPPSEFLQGYEFVADFYSQNNRPLLSLVTFLVTTFWQHSPTCSAVRGICLFGFWEFTEQSKGGCVFGRAY
jgi:hypothetical protein